MKKLLKVFAFVGTLLTCSHATQLPVHHIELQIETVAPEKIETYKNYFWNGYNKALSFFLDERSRKALFNLGINDVKNGNLGLLSAQKVTSLGGFAYVAHVLYAKALSTYAEWIAVKHCGYVGDQDIWVRAFEMMFNAIQEQEKASLACAVINVEENASWIDAITSLGFIACPELGDSEGCEGCIWYVRPFQKSVNDEQLSALQESDGTPAQQKNSCLNIL